MNLGLSLTRMLRSASPAFNAAGCIFCPTNMWLSLAQASTCVKYHSGLSSLFVCRTPLKWYSNLCRNGLSSNATGWLSGKAVIPGAITTWPESATDCGGRIWKTELMGLRDNDEHSNASYQEQILRQGSQFVQGFLGDVGLLHRLYVR